MSESKDTRRESPYTTIVVAAMEARRLNAVRLRGGMGALADDKITNEAMRRAFGGDVEFEIVERSTTAVAPPGVELDDEAESPSEESAPAEEKEDPSFGD